MIIIFIGLPGSGKGTQAKILAEKLKVEHLSTGEMFRQLSQENTKEGELLNKYLTQGALLPSDFVNKIVKTFLLDKKYNNSILDGYPRTLTQAIFLDDLITTELKVVYLRLDNQAIIKRILGRYTCKQCGKIYNKYFANTKQIDKCDVCNSKEFIYRNDDTEETINNRIEEYKKETLPLVEYYRNKGVLVTIDASKSEEEIASQLESVLKKD